MRWVSSERGEDAVDRPTTAAEVGEAAASASVAGRAPAPGSAGADACRAADALLSIAGAEGGGLALGSLARGGVWVAGGIAPRLLSRIVGPAAAGGAARFEAELRGADEAAAAAASRDAEDAAWATWRARAGDGADADPAAARLRPDDPGWGGALLAAHLNRGSRLAPLAAEFPLRVVLDGAVGLRGAASAARALVEG